MTEPAIRSVSLPLLMHRGQNDAIQRVAVFRALQLGDMLCAVPALRALRAALPEAHITLIGLPWAAQFVSRFHRYLDDFVAFPGHPAFPEQAARQDSLPAFYESMRSRQFDLALQLHGSGPTSNQIVALLGAKQIAGCTLSESQQEDTTQHTFGYPESGAEPLRLLQLLEFLGAPPTLPQLEFPITENDRRELEQSGLNEGLRPQHYLCVHAGARARDKCWQPALFARVADHLAEEFNLQIVLTGSANERELAAEVASYMRHPALNAATSISIGAMAALMQQARLLICNDTGVSHIAAGLGLPSVVVFSKSELERWAPLDHERHRCVWDPEGMQAETVLAHARALLRCA